MVLWRLRTLRDLGLAWVAIGMELLQCNDLYNKVWIAHTLTQGMEFIVATQHFLLYFIPVISKNRIGRMS